MGFPRSARTPHHFFVQLSPSWLNGRILCIKIGIGAIWNKLLQSKPDSRVHETNFRAWRWSLLLVPKALEIILALFLGQIRYVSWSTVLCEDVNDLKSFCKPRKIFPFPVTCSNKLGCWLSGLHLWWLKEICVSSDATTAQIMTQKGFRLLN